MPAYFELSLILKERLEESFFKNEFKLKFDWLNYQGELNFLRDKKVLFQEYCEPDFNEYEFSIQSDGLFTRENVIDKIKLLLSDIVLLNEKIQFEFAIGNIESNSWFISENKIPLQVSNDMILKSSLIFVTESKITELNINMHHLIFLDRGMICLFNPISGLLYSSSQEKYKILRDSI